MLLGSVFSFHSGPKRAVPAAFFAGFFTNGSDIGYKIQQKNPPTPPFLGSKAKLKTDPKLRIVAPPGVELAEGGTITRERHTLAPPFQAVLKQPG
jgi:hypothetical protein